MADPAITGALNQRKSLESKIAECEAKIRRYRAQLTDINKFISQWERFSGQSAFDFGAQESLKDNRNLSQNETDSSSSARKRNPKKEVVAEAVARILAQNGKPMMRADLFKALENEGVHITGTNPEMVLSTMLWRAGEAFRIDRLKSGGYWFSDQPLDDDPPAEEAD